MQYKLSTGVFSSDAYTRQNSTEVQRLYRNDQEASMFI